MTLGIFLSVISEKTCLLVFDIKIHYMYMCHLSLKMEGKHWNLS